MPTVIQKLGQALFGSAGSNLTKMTHGALWLKCLQAKVDAFEYDSQISFLKRQTGAFGPPPTHTHTQMAQRNLSTSLNREILIQGVQREFSGNKGTWLRGATRSINTPEFCALGSAASWPWEKEFYYHYCFSLKTDSRIKPRARCGSHHLNSQ